MEALNQRLRVEHLLTIEVPSRFVGVPLPLQYFGQTMNISRGGLGVRVPRLPNTIRAGIDVNVQLQPRGFNHEEEGIFMMAKVIWCLPHSFGLKIAEIAPSDRELYEKLFPEITQPGVPTGATPPPFKGARYVPRIAGSYTSEIDITRDKLPAASPEAKTQLTNPHGSREIVLPLRTEKVELDLTPLKKTGTTRR